MITITPERKDIAQPSKTKKYASSIRLWHWLNALVITGSLLTVLLNSTLLKTRKNALLIKSDMLHNGVTVTDQQSRSAAHVLSDKVWDVHIYFGYALAALLIFRLVAEFFLLADQRLMRKIKYAYHQYYTIKKNREASRHEFWVKTLYAIFYLLLMVTVITGFCLVFEDEVPALKELRFIRSIHQINMYLILAFIAIHLAGVYLAERKKESKGIVSDMINGG